MSIRKLFERQSKRDQDIQDLNVRIYKYLKKTTKKQFTQYSADEFDVERTEDFEDVILHISDSEELYDFEWKK